MGVKYKHIHIVYFLSPKPPSTPHNGLHTRLSTLTRSTNAPKTKDERGIYTLHSLFTTTIDTTQLYTTSVPLVCQTHCVVILTHTLGSNATLCSCYNSIVSYLCGVVDSILAYDGGGRGSNPPRVDVGIYEL